jgi:hypothetical protein
VTTLFDAASHEPLTVEPWDDGRAAAAIAAIVDDAEGRSIRRHCGRSTSATSTATLAAR